ncbi:MAG TPA: hypothetical protein DEF47_00095 [Herpetosiphon sp.]|uniref:Lipoprotein n=1 Tax=Herpetosiphon aurantiacus (strain ATCC 23779 / DSM 785 / 114-95) TaxID=316274 RepID=A9B3F2_HERA2|nr:hypothetical protein [Herpetosiphon sp.]ABX04115.1 hypothetical protein Haur_1471 [Herpetosiphon aurantiacus DSM 785]HBW48290.1 hypothetical protein [Herpetosiphon sp.]
MRWRFGLLSCLSIILLSCASQTPDQPTPTAFGDLSAITAGTGYIQIFSGMPNPSWLLNANAVDAIQQVLQTATPATTRPEPPGLGYSGMYLELMSTGMPLRLTVFGEVIAVEQGASTHYLNDPNHVFERWLLEQARPQLQPAIYAMIKKNLP